MTIEKAASQFGLNTITILETLSDGLIHNTYKVGAETSCIILQQINQTVFKSPAKIVTNYSVLYNYLIQQAYKIPKPLQTNTGQWLWIDENKLAWRAQEYFNNSYTISIVNTHNAFLAAHSFAHYAKTLSGLNNQLVQETISDFHNLPLRYSNLESAIHQASADRLQNAEIVIEKIRAFKRLVDFYNSITKDSSFQKRLMHHDCKLSNVLFDTTTNNVICPIDLDTTMPGYFFSDIGDIIRSMTPSLNENSTDWERLFINKEIYDSVIAGYLDGIGNSFSVKERNSIHHAGMLLLFMQAARFLEDYLSNDRYYKVTNSEQNLNRAKNQLILLDSLHQLLRVEYNYFF